MRRAAFVLALAMLAICRPGRAEDPWLDVRLVGLDGKETRLVELVESQPVLVAPIRGFW